MIKINEQYSLDEVEDHYLRKYYGHKFKLMHYCDLLNSGICRFFPDGRDLVSCGRCNTVPPEDVIKKCLFIAEGMK